MIEKFQVIRCHNIYTYIVRIVRVKDFYIRDGNVVTHLLRYFLVVLTVTNAVILDITKLVVLGCYTIVHSIHTKSYVVTYEYYTKFPLRDRSTNVVTVSEYGIMT
jgi:hypothetical protein